MFMRRFMKMISRMWWGWTTLENADAYEEMLRTTVLPGIRQVNGFGGAYVLRRKLEDEVEFAVITLWESMDAIREFAGEDPEVEVVPPEPRKLLARCDPRSKHYDTVIELDVG